MSHSFRRRGADGPTEILLVEDNPGDVRLVREAFEETGRETRVHAVADGNAAIDFLVRRAADEPASLPAIALVDLNLPGTDGCEVLESIRDDPHLRYLPVIILTSSTDRADVARCYDATANAYLAKPTDPGEFASMAEAIERFWFEEARLPPIPS